MQSFQNSLFSNQNIVTSKILKDISHIRFNFLTQLHLFGNQIQNIEILCFLNVPNLYSIKISYNKISKICKTISKMHFKNLQNIIVSDNFIYSADLGRVQSLHENGLRIQFYHDQYGTSYNCCSIFDKSIYAKVKNLDKDFQISDDVKIQQPYRYRILQKKCMRALQRKANKYKRTAIRSI